MSSERDDELERFVRGRAGALLRYGYVLTGNPHDAADLTQEALARLGLAWPRVRHRGDPEAYVRTTMARLHISRWRRLRREVLVGEPPERGQHDAGLARADEADSDMWRALATLPTKQRAVLVLRYYEQLTDDEIAAMLGITKVTVRTQAHRALAKLRDVVTTTLDLTPGGAS